MNETVLNEAERYGFPIIAIGDDGKTAFNSAAFCVRALSDTNPLSLLYKKDRERALALPDGMAFAVKFKGDHDRPALIYRRFGHLIFMYLPMLSGVGRTPSEAFSLNVSASDLPELWAKLSLSLFSKTEIPASSFARISSIASTLAFSEDVVSAELDGDGSIDCEVPFYMMGKALNDLDTRDATELCDPCVKIAFSFDKLTLSLYGEEFYSERARAFTVVAPFSFTEDEYRAAFIFAVATAIFKARK